MTDYPTTCAELKAMIDAEWPDVRRSRLAIELCDAETLEFLADDSEKKERSILSLIHRVLRPCGFEIEGVACDEHPMLFTEEQSVRALWFQYNRLTPASDFVTDLKPVMFVWREEPTTMLRNGIWTARMRYSCLWRNYRGELQPLSYPDISRRAA